ncbi:ABC transporter ATP-binding protein [Paracoccus marinus]|uniref:ABC transporter ATP-binding protein n=1 Tax=Paracoccus marinus TaxID=288426 RepID=UPI00163D442F|nr:ABC transporter ATP-binding protein [Paracoccus marinus]GLS79620.1 ABC transporter ATP-binding protein [Paracoccus marinus]
MSILALEEADVFYGKAQALQRASIAVGQGEIVSLIGRNGAGKSTTLKAAIGLAPLRAGRRVLGGQDVTGLKPSQLARRGIAFVPEDRRIFANLSVHENLVLAQVMDRRGPWTMDRVWRLFPVLKDRGAQPGNTLSGGEQQMLAIARGLLTNPAVLLLDEPTEGLAPLVVEQLTEAMRTINAEGMAILLVEQNLRVPMKLAHRQYVIDHGAMLWSGTTADLLADRARVEALISI